MTPVIDALADLLHNAQSTYRREQSNQDARRHCNQDATLEREAEEAVHCEVYYSLKKLVDNYNCSLKIDMDDMERRHAKELAALQAKHAAERKEVEANHDREWFSETKLEKIKDEYDAAIRTAIIGAVEDYEVLWQWERSEIANRIAEEKQAEAERLAEEQECAVCRVTTHNEPELMTLTQLDAYRERKLLDDCEAMRELCDAQDQREADAKHERNRPRDGQPSKIGQDGKPLYLFEFWNGSGGHCHIWALNQDDATEQVVRYTNGRASAYPVTVEKWSR